MAGGFWWWGLAEGQGAGLGVIFGRGLGAEDCGCMIGCGTGSEDIGSGGGHAAKDLGCLLGRFALGVDDLGEAGAEEAMVIDLGEVEVFEG